MNHYELKEKALKKKGVNAEYVSLETEFFLLREMLKARQAAGLNQAQIAEKMGTKAPGITRLESSLTNGKHSPSLATIKKYAEAVGCHLEIKLVKNSEEKLKEGEYHKTKSVAEINTKYGIDT
jgi:transcriptional regulator with XRE-family HTH domain